MVQWQHDSQACSCRAGLCMAWAGSCGSCWSGIASLLPGTNTYWETHSSDDEAHSPTAPVAPLAEHLIPYSAPDDPSQRGRKALLSSSPGERMLHSKLLAECTGGEGVQCAEVDWDAPQPPPGLDRAANGRAERPASAGAHQEQPSASQAKAQRRPTKARDQQVSGLLQRAA